MLLLALSLFAGAAMTQSVAKPGNAAPAPAAMAPAAAAQAIAPVLAEPSTTTASFGDWVLRCQRIGEGDAEPRICEVGQSMQAQGQKVPIAQIAIGRSAAGEPLRVTVVLQPDLSFPSSARWSATAAASCSICPGASSPSPAASWSRPRRDATWQFRCRFVALRPPSTPSRKSALDLGTVRRA
jgi:hypothetical protein